MRPHLSLVLIPVVLLHSCASRVQRSGHIGPDIDTADLERVVRYPNLPDHGVQEGYVSAILEIDTTGRIDHLTLGGSVNRFGSAVKEALQRTTILPYTANGRVRNSWELLLFRFMREQSSPGYMRRYITVQEKNFGIGIVPEEIVSQYSLLQTRIVELPETPSASKGVKFPDWDEFVDVERVPMWDPVAFRKRIKYPDVSRLDSIEGTIIIRALIDMNGRARKLMIESSIDPDLEKAALDAVAATEFTPAIQNSRLVLYWLSMPIDFKLH